MVKGIQRWSSYKYWPKPIPRNRRSLGNICLSLPKLRSVHTTAGQPQKSMHHLFFKLSITAVSYPCIVSICETSLEGLRSAPSDTRHTSQLQYVSTQPVSHQGCIQDKHAPIQYHQALARFIIIRSRPSPVLDTSSQPSQAISSNHVIPEPEHHISWERNGRTRQKLTQLGTGRAGVRSIVSQNTFYFKIKQSYKNPNNQKYKKLSVKYQKF